MAVEMNKYLKQFPKLKVLDMLDGAEAAFPEFYEYCVEARYVYFLGFYDIVSIVFRVALESLLEVYIKAYCGRRIDETGQKIGDEALDNKHRLDRSKLNNLINTWLKDVKCGSEIERMANPIRVMGNDCAHNRAKPDKKKVDELWSSLVKIYLYISRDIIDRRIQERIDDLVKVPELILNELFNAFGSMFTDILEYGGDN